MPKTRAHLRTSRRVPSLKDTDVDHEISLVDRTASLDESRALSPDIDDTTADLSAEGQALVTSESRSPLTQDPQEPAQDARPPDGVEPEAGPSGEQAVSQPSTSEVQHAHRRRVSALLRKGQSRMSSRNKRLSQHRPHPPKEPETEIDVLYENERGGFLCGIPLFSSAALGNLDPPPWTNGNHKPSPTDIRTAQVPDPSWEWAWPEWRVNRDEAIETDNDGWEYSFMFSKKFSWHGPKWYDSFVRRRAWIRRRIKKGLGYQANDPHMMNPEYFAVTPAKKKRRSLSTAMEEVSDVDGASIGGQSRRSRDIMPVDEEDDDHVPVELETAEDLLTILKRSRIDREKLEAVESYIKHCKDDLLQLQEYMHEIMSIFVFQASRKLLLSRLIQLHDDEQAKEKKGKAPKTNNKLENLGQAIKHADEEVRRLEYWSDIKNMTENGESGGAVDRGKGWGEGWEGLDKSGAKGVKEEDTIP
ncbi:hypothetical protein F4778DRAFT_317782 [Xylariomycetidae sp. FL2044]|nr:hypothetical protein F4778DRAFT_317782 [Xylariomycetidae sp. FL2044]